MSEVSKKDPVETIPLTFDFANQMDRDETVLSAEVEISVKSGTDPNSDDMLLDAATVSGKRAQQFIQGGLDGVVYFVRCKVTTSGNKVLILVADMPVETAS